MFKNALIYRIESWDPPALSAIDRDCELKQPDSEKASVRYARHTLDIDEMAQPIRQGKLPTPLAMTWPRLLRAERCPDAEEDQAARRGARRPRAREGR